MAILLCLMIAPFCQRQLLSTVVFRLKVSSDKFSFQVCIRQKTLTLIVNFLLILFNIGSPKVVKQHTWTWPNTTLTRNWNYSIAKNRTSSCGSFTIIDLQLIQVHLNDHPNYLQWSLMMINELVVCYENWPRIFCQWYSGDFHGRHRIIDKMSNLSTDVSKYQSHFSSFYFS